MAKDQKITYKDNPELFESVIRQNLSSKAHTRQTLIDYGVHITIEAEKLDIQLASLQDKHGKLSSELNLLMQFLNRRSYGNDLIADILESDFKSTHLANLLRAAKKVDFRHNKANASASRKKDKPTFEDVEHFKREWCAEYFRKNGVNSERGWRNACQIHLGVSNKTLKKIYP